jgi:hypothetical protein
MRRHGTVILSRDERRVEIWASGFHMRITYMAREWLTEHGYRWRYNEGDWYQDASKWRKPCKRRGKWKNK